MAAGSASVDTMLADAISKMDALNKRMDALETGPGSKNPIKGDGAKKSDDDDDDDKKDDSKKADAKKGDDGELEIKHKGREKDDSSKKADAKKADAKKA